MTDGTPDEKLAIVDDHGKYAVITINRPAKRNAVNIAAQQALVAAFERCRGARVIVITGRDDWFCSGIDIVESREMRVRGDRTYANGSDHWFEVQEVIRRHPAICIAAVNGLALGGGLTLVNNCELAVASSNAEFAMPEIGFGAFPTISAPSTLHRILPKHAVQMMFTAKRIDAETALRWGLINEIVPHENTLSRAEELAAHIAQFDEITLDYAKKAYRQVLSLEWSDAIEYGLLTGRIIRAQTSVSSEGVAKFAAGVRTEGQGG